MSPSFCLRRAAFDVKTLLLAVVVFGLALLGWNLVGRAWMQAMAEAVQRESESERFEWEGVETDIEFDASGLGSP